MGVPPTIKLACSSWDQLEVLLESDLKTGVFRLRLAKQPPVGHPVRIDLGLPSGQSVTIGGQVKRHAPEHDDPARGLGVEVLITHFPPDALFLIESSLSAARERARAAEDASDLSQPPDPDTWNDKVAREFDPLPTDPTSGPKSAPVGAELVAALRAEKLSLEAQTPFEQLGIGPDATDEDVRAAFLRATRRYSPDQLSRYPGDESRALAGEIYIILRDAWRRVHDANARDLTRAQLRQERGAPSVRSIPFPPVTTPVPLSTDMLTPEKVLSFRPARTGAGQGGTLVPPIAASQITPAPIPPESGPDGAESGEPAGLSHEDLFSDLAPIDDAPPLPTGISVLQAMPPEVVRANALLDGGQVDEALQLFDEVLKNRSRDRDARAGKELAFGYRALAKNDRLAASRHFGKALEMIPANERAARALDALRRAAGQSGPRILERLLGKK